MENFNRGCTLCTVGIQPECFLRDWFDFQNYQGIEWKKNSQIGDSIAMYIDDNAQNIFEVT